MRNLFDKLVVIAKYEAIIAFRYRNGAPFRIVATVVEIVSAFFLAKAVGPQFRPDGLSYFAFLLTGGSIYLFMLTIVSTCVDVVDNAQRAGTMEVLMTTSTPPLQVLLLHVAPTVLWRTAATVLYIVVGMRVFATEALSVNVPAGVTVFAILILVAISLGIIAAALQMLFFRGNSLVWALGVVGGMFMGTVFPISVLPKTLQCIASVLPLRSSLDVFRAALLQNASLIQLYPALLRLLITGCFLLLLGIVCFQWSLTRARKLGTLAFY